MPGEYRLSLVNQANQVVGDLIILKEELSKSKPEKIFTIPISGKFNCYKKIYCKVLSKKESDTEFLPIYQTEVKEFFTDVEIRWKKIGIREKKFSNDKNSKSINIQVYEKEKNKSKMLSHELFSIQSLKSKERKMITIQNVGKIFIEDCSLYDRYTFHEYLMRGLNISMILAIDFSSSNGFQDSPNSLHHLDYQNSRKNEYVRAISDIGNILANLDQDHLIPVFG